jgi:uncharacterized OB-fold protein
MSAMDETHPAALLPLPPKLGFAGEFYDFLRKRELRFQRCADCGTWRHLPRDLCAKCSSPRWEWAKSSGRGKLFSWTTVAQPALPQFAAYVPYTAVIVEMDEGVRLVSWLTGVAPQDVALGMPLEVVFEDVTPDVTLHRFRRVR